MLRCLYSDLETCYPLSMSRRYRYRVASDASYYENDHIGWWAGLGVYSQVLGSHSRCEQIRGSTRAEITAMAWAMELAIAQFDDAAERFTFVTDCTSVKHAFRGSKWNIVCVPRRYNIKANKLARHALHEVVSKSRIRELDGVLGSES